MRSLIIEGSILHYNFTFNTHTRKHNGLVGILANSIKAAKIDLSQIAWWPYLHNVIYGYNALFGEK
jgi:hypothetical protein